jgi:hypothetical protein
VQPLRLTPLQLAQALLFPEIQFARTVAALFFLAILNSSDASAFCGAPLISNNCPFQARKNVTTLGRESEKLIGEDDALQIDVSGFIDHTRT